jgi:hypothetical protein
MTDPTRSDPTDPTANVAPDPEDLATAEGVADERASGSAPRDQTGILDVSAPADEDFEDREGDAKAQREELQLEEAAAALAATGAAPGTTVDGAAVPDAPRGRAGRLGERFRGRARTPAVPAAGTAGAAAALGAATSPAAAAARTDELPYVDDRFSKIWVAAIVGVFALIFLNAIFLGNGGILTTSPSPSPVVTQSASPSASPPASPSTSPSPSPSGTPSASPDASPSPSGASPSPS